MAEKAKETLEIWDSERIRTARQLAGITRDNAAELLSIHPAYFTMIEQDKRQPGPSVIARMAGLYNQPLAYFLKSEKNLVLA